MAVEEKINHQNFLKEDIVIEEGFLCQYKRQIRSSVCGVCGVCGCMFMHMQFYM